MNAITKLATASDGPSFSSRARGRRWKLLHETFPDLQNMRVLDLGGEVAAWSSSPVMPAELTLLNFGVESETNQQIETVRGAKVDSVAGDACEPPAALFERKFDLVYCNSVIEHVGGHYRRVQLANSVYGLAPHHWLQTPYRYFPIEPHFVAPGFQFLPSRLRAAALRRWPIGNVHEATDSLIWPETEVQAESSKALNGQPLNTLPMYHSVKSALSFELLSATEFAYYFPQSRVLRERFLGLTKSLIAVR